MLKLFLRNGSIDWIGVYLVAFSDYSGKTKKQNTKKPKTFVWLYNPGKFSLKYQGQYIVSHILKHYILQIALLYKCD